MESNGDVAVEDDEMTIESTSDLSENDLTKSLDFHRALEKSCIEAAVENFTCIICLEVKSHDVRTIGPAMCECTICLPCVKEWLQYALQNETGLIKCPECKEPVIADFLDILEYPKDIVIRFLIKQNTIRKLSDPKWYWCPARKCYGGGQVIEKPSPFHFMTKLVWGWVWSLFGYRKDTSKYYDCAFCPWKGCILCERDHPPGTFCIKGMPDDQRESVEQLLREGREPSGKFRPCYFCGVVTERVSGCSVMTCFKCTQKWDWNLGRTLSSTWREEPMRYTPLKTPHLLK